MPNCSEVEDQADTIGVETNPPDIDSCEGDDQVSGPEPHRRPWVGIHFECCGAYARVYRNAEGSAYVGWCPRCQRQIRLKVGPGGTCDRFFRAS